MRTTPAALYAGLLAYRNQDLPRAIRAFRRAVEHDPTCAEASSHLLLLSLYDPEISVEQRFREHRSWAHQFEADSCHRRPNAQHPRVGYIRNSISKEPGGSFLRPVIRNHDPSAFSIYCYSDDPADRELPANWRSIRDLDAAAIQTAIDEDQIDILVNIDGHFSYRLMRLFASRAAPVQVSLCNYPVSTGLNSIDIRLSDALADPIPFSDLYYTERLVHLCCFLPYDPPRFSPAAGRSPALENGFATFGCFNNPLKISAQDLERWASLLADVPGSRFLFHHPFLSEAPRPSAHKLRPGVVARLLEPFLRRAISADRVAFVGSLAQWDHLYLHNQVDLLMDTYPYSGVTTTFEALWMGVPVIASESDCFLSRTSAVILQHARLGPLVVSSRAKLQGLALKYAETPKDLASMRSDVAELFRESIFLNHHAIARDIEHAYREALKQSIA